MQCERQQKTWTDAVFNSVTVMVQLILADVSLT